MDSMLGLSTFIRFLFPFILLIILMFFIRSRSCKHKTNLIFLVFETVDLEEEDASKAEQEQNQMKIKEKK